MYIFDQVFSYRRWNQQHVVVALGGTIPVDSLVVFHLLGFDPGIIRYESVVSILSNYFSQVDSHHWIHLGMIIVCLGILSRCGSNFSGHLGVMEFLDIVEWGVMAVSLGICVFRVIIVEFLGSIM